MIASIIIFIVMMTVVVFLHEGGHFLMAKIFNIYTKSFSIGFGPILYKKKFKETEFQVRAVPLGGMVEIPMEYANDQVPEDIDPKRLYYNKKPYQKFFVAFAGPLVNMIIAYLLFSIIVSMVGITPTVIDHVMISSPSKTILREGDQIVSVAGKKIYSPGELSYFLKQIKTRSFSITILRDGKILHLTAFSTYTTPQKHLIIEGKVSSIKTINSAGPTHYEYNDQTYVWVNGKKHKIYSYYATDKRKVIGVILRTFLPVSNTSVGEIRKEDRFIKIGDVKINSSYDLQNAIYKYFGYKDGKVYTDITILNNSINVNMVGGYTDVSALVLRNGKPVSVDLTLDEISKIELKSLPRIKMNFFEGVPMTNQFFALSIESLFSKQGVKDISGPVGVAYFIYQTRNAGFMALLNLFALISLGLAIFNLLPIPPLDGSRMLYSLIEIVIRRKISSKVQIIIDNMGVILLILFIVFVTYHDILRFFK